MGVIMRNGVAYGGQAFDVNMIARPYNNAATYDVNDFCVYNGSLYRCKETISSSGVFDPTKWESDTLSSYMTDWLNIPLVDDEGY